MIIAITLLAALLGALIYALAGNGKLVELGRLLFFAGVLAFLLRTSPESISFLR